ncbi:GL15216 [Drosophila persimilis]|uniref:GL15216 n=1 Tax=Drosophila persimilis TaxID=7234 RepID=B4H3P5_DROPE|nr:bax inhibitor 1 [Drosophila persimilis]EDW30996.1 GL15216 [Drosophila persimilis]
MAAVVAQKISNCFQTCVNGLNYRYEPHVRHHLCKVYMIIGSTAAATAVGSVLQIEGVLDFGLLAAVLTLLLVLGLHFYKDDGNNYQLRLAMLYGFGFFAGQTIGPLLGCVGRIDPSIIVTALIGTFFTFITLSLTALLSEQSKYLFIGGTLVSALNTMAVLSLFNMIVKSYAMQVIQLYVGVLVMSAFVVYDTQDIVEKCRNGHHDFVQHAMDLFFDVLSMFRRVLLILKRNAEGT